MLSRIPVHGFDALRVRLFRCRASIALRPIITRHLAPTCSSSGSQQRRLLSDSPPATTTTTASASAAAEDRRRRWVMLSSCGLHRRPDDDTTSVTEDDANTVAECRISEGQGRRLRVSFRFAAPPAISYLFYDFLSEGASCLYDNGDRISVVAAHGESLLLEMRNSRTCSSSEHFVYRAAPPSPSLLPVPTNSSGSIGVLRRGDNDDDLLVVRVQVESSYEWDVTRWQQTAVLCVLRPGMREWEHTEPLPVLQRGDAGNSPKDVIGVGDRFLCWVHYGRGSFLLCDMADDDGGGRSAPKVRHVPLPPAVSCCRNGTERDDEPMMFRRMGAAGDSSVRLVSIHPYCCRSEDPDYGSSDDHYRCCCDNPSESMCLHRSFVFSVRTWTMDLGMDDDEPLEWVEDEAIAGEEIWALPGYQGLPQAIPEWPVVCLDDPDVVCFLVSNFHFTMDDDKVWMIQLNVKTKALLSVVQLTDNDDYCYWNSNHHLPADIQY